MEKPLRIEAFQDEISHPRHGGPYLCVIEGDDEDGNLSRYWDVITWYQSAKAGDYDWNSDNLPAGFRVIHWQELPQLPPTRPMVEVIVRHDKKMVTLEFDMDEMRFVSVDHAVRAALGIKPITQ